MEEFKSTYPLIHNKVTSPRFVTPTLRRARLIDWLSANSEARAVVIAAGAGYGKTTLLWQWEQEADFPCYWYKLDRNDRDWTLHISYLVEAVSQHHPGFGRRAHSILRQMGGPGSSRPGVAAFLLAEMQERLTQPCTFIIDDWQYVASVTEVRGLWNQILRDAPPTCRFIFASRGKPQLQFARFKTHGGYAELRTDDLRVTAPEITELFRDVYRNPLTPDEVVELERRTEGWAASLQLVQVSLRERRTPEARRALIDSLTARSDSDLFAFLAEEVLDQQTEETRNFLLSTAILQQITPELAERLAGVHDGVRRLLQLEHAGLFTYRLDETRYRYHGLFREFLERRLADERSDAEVMGLHIHAASYFETSSQWPEAIYHYLRAGLQRQAARLIARYGEDVVTEGRLGLVDEWLGQLPDKTIRDNARLSLLHGEALGIRGEWEPAIAALERARDFFAKKQDRRMEALALVKESSVFHHWGRPHVAAEVAHKALDLLPPGSPTLRLRLEGNLAITTAWLSGEWDQVETVINRVTAEAAQVGLDHYAAIGAHNLGALQLEMGKLKQAVKSLKAAAAFWRELPPNPFADNYNLARALIAQAKLHEAEEVAAEGVRRTQNWPRAHAEACMGLALVRAAQGRLEDALELLRPLVFSGSDLGFTTEIAMIHFLELVSECATSRAEALAAAAQLRHRELDPRLDVSRSAALAALEHRLGVCKPGCGLSALDSAQSWMRRGARLQACLSLIRLAPPLLDHHGSKFSREISNAVLEVHAMGAASLLRTLSRHLRPHLDLLAAEGRLPLLSQLLRREPDFWIEAALHAGLRVLNETERADLISLVERQSQPTTVHAISELAGADIAALRLRLLEKYAQRLFLRTFGGISIHRGSWSGPEIEIGKKRIRSLLSLLVANGGGPVGRDTILDALWPEADPAAAINSLNQTLFQLRRAFDSKYRDGRSAQYILSSNENVQLNPELVRLDWVDVLRHASALEISGSAHGLLELVDQAVRGEFLWEARFEDWSVSPRRRIHEQLRNALLPLATSSTLEAPGKATIARALTALDEWDEQAQAALSTALAMCGQRIAGRRHLEAFVKRLRTEFDEAPGEEVRQALTIVGVKS